MRTRELDDRSGLEGLDTHEPAPIADRSQAERTAGEPDGGSVLQVLIFLTESANWSVPIENVIGIERDPGIVEVPSSTGAVVGIYHVKGRLMPVIDLDRLLTRSAEKNEQARYVVNVAANGYESGFLATAVREVTDVNEGTMSAPASEFEGLADAQFVLGAEHHILLGTGRVLEMVANSLTRVIK